MPLAPWSVIGLARAEVEFDPPLVSCMVGVCGVVAPDVGRLRLVVAMPIVG